MVVGRVAGAYGVRGWLKVACFGSARDSALPHAAHWYLSGRPDVDAAPRAARQARVHGAHVVAQLDGIASREAAEALKGAEVSVSRSAFPPLPEGEFYWVDLIGCRVESPRGTDLGVVSALADHGAHALLSVTGPDGVERLIPFVEPHVVDVDTGARRIVADWELDY